MSDFHTMEVSELKKYIRSNGGEIEGCLTKEDLAERAADVSEAIRLRDKRTDARRKEKTSGPTPTSSGSSASKKVQHARTGWRKFLAERFPPFPGVPRTNQSVSDPKLRDYRDHPYDDAGFKSLSFPKRVGLFARAWALQGNVQPGFVSFFYWFKTWLYYACVWWVVLPSLLEDARPSPLDELARVCAFSAAWEAMGLGCGSGPNSAKFIPPFTSWWHFFTPGTALVPVLPSCKRCLRERRRPASDGPALPPPELGDAAVLKRTTRTIVECSLFAAFLFSCISVVFEPEGPSSKDKMTRLIFCIAVLSLRDATFALACRLEVYGSMLLIHTLRLSMGLTPESEWAALRGAQLGIWVWAGFSKLGPWWDYVLPVMNSCNPALASSFVRPVRTEMYENWPTSVEPSSSARLMAKLGSYLEILFPMCLAIGGMYFGRFGLIAAIGMHTFIVTQIPMGAPLEWNVFTMVSACVLFGGGDPQLGLGSLKTLMLSDFSYPGWNVWDLNSTYLVYLALAHVALPLAGNWYPSRVSFLLASRYYAGNWPTTLWLVKRSELRKLSHLKTIGGFPHEQLAFLFGDDDADGESPKLFEQFEYRVLVGRMMHLTSRALLRILPQISNLDEYYMIEGELVCGTVLGWSFGDGHLAGTELLRHVRAKCGFRKGELLHVEIEALPWREGNAEWALRDACEVEQPIAKGSMSREELMSLKL